MAGAQTQGCTGSRAWNGANVSPRFRARARADATPGVGAWVWAQKSGVHVKIGFDDVIVRKLSMFNGVCVDPRATHRVLFHSACIQS